jgi:SAM-dependent methyltransferase
MGFVEVNVGEEVFDRVARLYDYEQKDFVKDIPFYLEYAKKCRGEVLELGCGTGRVLLPITEAGIKVTGIDASQEMLDVAQKKVDKKIRRYVTLIQADMASLELAKKFSLIFIAFRSFQCLLTKEKQISCLRSIWKHLRDDGIFILDLFAPKHDLLAQVERKLELTAFHDDENGVDVTRRCEDIYDLAKQTLHEDRFYEWTDKSGKSYCQKWSFDLSYLFRYETELLLEKCGFTVEKVYGDFDKSPYDYYSGEQIFVAGKSS